MCGFIEFRKSSVKATSLFQELQLDSDQPLPLFRDNLGSGPATSIDIIISREGERIPVAAIWWLLLDENLKPSRYTSFNTRADKLKIRNSAGYQLFRKSRCIVPATGIVEGEGAKKNRKYHFIEPQHTAFALGGLFKEWRNRATAEIVYSCSVITLPPHSTWQGIHSKSTPLFLPHSDQTIIDKWLDPAFNQVGEFERLLFPYFRDTLLATPVDKPMSRNAMGETFII